MEIILQKKDKDIHSPGQYPWSHPVFTYCIWLIPSDWLIYTHVRGRHL